MDDHLKRLFSRLQPDGGFQFSSQRPSRPDATAWAVFILSLSNFSQTSLEMSRDYLGTFQHEDGRVSIDEDHPEAFWPTPLAVLAWQASPDHSHHFHKAVSFLMSSSGEHWTRQPNSPLKHDTALRGWPWIDHTHSWVESTSTTMIALHLAGQTNHPRLQEATALLLDRQLPQGGWNYGNTLVFEKELRPSPEDTGAALSALAGRVEKTQVIKSLQYLLKEVPTLRTPIALGWSLLGLQAWNQAPPDSSIWIDETLNRHTRHGEYDTPSLCLLLTARFASRGFNNLIVGEHNRTTDLGQDH